MTDPATERPEDRLRYLVDRLLVRDADAHAAAIEALAEEGDERVVPHLVEVMIVDSVANDWERFGFPAILRSRDPPRYLELPEVRWPGARDALAELTDAAFDSDYAWVEWETWYSQRDVDPLAGFDAWKRRLYRSYLPPVGGLLDCEPRAFDMRDVRWGNTDRSHLAALNAPDFVPGSVADVDGNPTPSSGDDSHDGNETGGGYLADDDHVFGFELDGTACTVPRWVLFPHELANLELDGVPVSLTYCTLCNAPILYDRRVGDGGDDGDDRDADDGDVLTFGSTGMLLAGNKVMYDEETESLWDQHRGTPIAGRYLETDADTVLDQYPVTQTDWGRWKAEYPDTMALDVETGYGYDYEFYRGDVGFFRHYWHDEDVVQPGVRAAGDVGALPEKESVYGVVADDGSEVWVVPVSSLDRDSVLVGEADGRRVVALVDTTGDVAVFEAPPEPVERSSDGLVDGDGTEWTAERDVLRAADGTVRNRVPGRHGLWFAFRTHYDEAHVIE